jgi:hypothetical protein
MVIWGIVTWWYTDGWRQCWLRFHERLEATLDFFSIDLLLRTLFAPFRQISAGGVNGPLDMQLQAFFDRLISRCIGTVVRLIMIVVGGVTVLLSTVIGGLLLLLWAFVPLLPFIGVILYIAGWLPWNN